MGNTITSANAVLLLTVPLVFPTAQQIQGFSADNVYEIGQQDANETSMGIDGKFSAGFVFKEVEQTYELQSDSDSIDFFETWYQAMFQAVEAFPAFGTTTLPTLKKKYISSVGWLKNWKPLPPGKKILEPQTFAIVWQSVVPAPF